MTYPDQAAALAVVKSEAGIANTDRDTVLNNWLSLSKGVISGADEYRPHLVAAIAMHTSKGEQTLVSADKGVKFRQGDESANLLPAIRGQLRVQAALDSSQGTEVPTGWDVSTWLDSLCGCEGAGDAVSAGASYSTLFAGQVV